MTEEALDKIPSGIGFNHQVKGACKEEIAHQNRGAIAPNEVSRFFTAPQLTLIDNIIMEKRRGVNEFDSCSEPMMGLAFIAAHQGCRDGEEGPQPFPACAN